MPASTRGVQHAGCDLLPSLTDRRLERARDGLEELLQLALLLGLRLDPVAHDLLLAPHVLNEVADTSGKIGHGGVRSLRRPRVDPLRLAASAAAALLDGARQPLDRDP